MPETVPSQPFEAPLKPQIEDYRLLTGHYRTDRSYKTDEQLRAEYVHLTDELIRQMTEGVVVRDPETSESRVERPDAVVWLDKSARPVAWLTKELWPLLAQDQDGNVPEIPDFHFLNIDREQWVNTIDPGGSGLLDINRVDQSIIRSLRSIFIAPEHKREGLTKSIDHMPAALDSKTILVVDEVRASGRTLEIAANFLAKAFPTARIAKAHWMSGVANVGGAQGNADLPVWYKEAVTTGRGVGNRDERLSQRSKSQTQRLGGWFLSTRLSDPDPDSVQLRQELRTLARDAQAGNILVIPSYKREIDDFDERAERLNHTSLAGFIDAKRRLADQT